MPPDTMDFKLVLRKSEDFYLRAIMEDQRGEHSTVPTRIETVIISN